MQKPDFDIIIMPLTRWDSPYSSTAYSIAKELSRHTRVFYIDNPFTIKDYFTPRNKSLVGKRKNALVKGKDIFVKPDENYPQLVAVTPQLILPINWLPSGNIYNNLSRFNDKVVNKAINRTIEKFGIKRYIFINSFNPLFSKHFKFSVEPLLKVYQNVDDSSQSDYLYKHGPKLEADLIRNSDFTIVTSSELKRMSSRYSQHVYLLPNAANVKLFQKAVTEPLQKPKELAQIPPEKKIICYTGNICMRLDYELLSKVAAEHKDKILLMIGPLYNDNYKTSGLDKFPNVIFTGRKSIEELPAYLKYSDCCIIPFLCNQLTKSIYPLKINEYLSAGKPVISTNFSEDISKFSDIAAICYDHKSFVDNIDKAISQDSVVEKKRRIGYASQNNWETRAIEFIALANQFLAKPKTHKQTLVEEGIAIH
jgi:glycosyltransferase involved in cell wall biosynthesis